MKIEIMNKDKVSSVVTITGNKADTLYFTDDPSLYLIPKVPVDKYLLSEILESRCCPRERPGIGDVLKGLGLDYYDPVAICRKTHGLMRNDYLWLRFDDEPLVYDDIKIR